MRLYPRQEVTPDGASFPPPPRPPRGKLLHIRTALGLSQNELISRLSLSDEVTQARISAYECGVREPPLVVLLRYARAANVSVEALIDDEIDLSDKLPSRRKSEGVKVGRGAGATRGRKSKP